MDGVFAFNTTDPGQYSFVFSNMKQKKDKKVTFAIQIIRSEKNINSGYMITEEDVNRKI